MKKRKTKKKKVRIKAVLMVISNLNIKILIFFLIVFLIASCNKKEVLVKMPNQEVVKGESINDFEKLYDFKYYPFEGYKAKYDDSLLREFTVVLFSNSIYEERDIKPELDFKLRKEGIKEFRFKKIPETEISEVELVKYLESKYRNSHHVVIDLKTGIVNKKIMLLNKETSDLLCYVEFVSLGVPGYIVCIPLNIKTG